MTTAATTVQEVAEYLDVDLETVYRMVNRGDPTGFKVGGSWRFKKAGLDGWIAKLRQDAANKAGDDQ